MVRLSLIVSSSVSSPLPKRVGNGPAMFSPSHISQSQWIGSSWSKMTGTLSALRVGLSLRTVAGAGMGSWSFIRSSSPHMTAHRSLTPVLSLSSISSEATRNSSLAASPLRVKTSTTWKRPGRTQKKIQNPLDIAPMSYPPGQYLLVSASNNMLYYLSQ